MPTAFIRLVPAHALCGGDAMFAHREGVYRPPDCHHRARHGCGTATCRADRVPAA